GGGGGGGGRGGGGGGGGERGGGGGGGRAARPPGGGGGGAVKFGEPPPPAGQVRHLVRRGRLPFGLVTAIIHRHVGPPDLRVRDDAPAPQATEIGQTCPALVRVPLQEFGHAAEQALDDVRPDRAVEQGRRADLHGPAAQQEIVKGVRELADAADP